MSDKPEQTVEKESVTLKSVLFDLMDLIEAAVVTFFVFTLIFTYICKPVTVEGGSMNRTLYDGDSLLMLTLFADPKPGNIVVVDDQHAGLFADQAQTQVTQQRGFGSVIVKRVIATAGQEINIDFDAGAVAVDGTQLAETYIADLTKRDDGAFSYPFVVPEGYLFVMGDNRMHSSDSRSRIVGLVPEDEVLGIVLARYNRNDSLCEKWTDRFDLSLWRRGQ